MTADSNVGRGIEFALGIAVFLGIGYVIDRWLGTQPVFMICFFLLGVVGQFAAMWYRYTEAMTALDAERTAGKHAHHRAEQRRSADTSGKGTP
jgi:F0F1-type ATP synthase assembly protein I